MVDCFRNAIEQMMTSGRLLTEGLKSQAKSLGLQVEYSQLLILILVQMVKAWVLRWWSRVPQQCLSSPSEETHQWIGQGPSLFARLPAGWSNMTYTSVRWSHLFCIDNSIRFVKQQLVEDTCYSGSNQIKWLNSEHIVSGKASFSTPILTPRLRDSSYSSSVTEKTG